MGTMKKPTVSLFRRMKNEGRKIVMLTAYDAPTAKLAQECGIDIILVGDSLGMAVLGYQNTLPVTLEQSLHHCAAVRLGAPDAFVIGDMPFMTCHASETDALKNAARYLQEAQCDAVKIEGDAALAPTVERMVHAGIPVMGHIGLLPQHIKTSGVYRVTGRKEEEAERIIADAKAMEAAGVFAMVLECMPAELGKQITEAVSVPTIGIGAGVHCSGQVQVVNDLLGLFTDFQPKHARRYANRTDEIRRAFTEYVSDVREQKFPGPENSF